MPILTNGTILTRFVRWRLLWHYSRVGANSNEARQLIINHHQTRARIECAYPYSPGAEARAVGDLLAARIYRSCAKFTGSPHPLQPEVRGSVENIDAYLPEALRQFHPLPQNLPPERPSPRFPTLQEILEQSDSAKTNTNQRYRPRSPSSRETVPQYSGRSRASRSM